MQKEDLYLSPPVKSRGNKEYKGQATKCYFLSSATTKHELNWVFLIWANNSKRCIILLVLQTIISCHYYKLSPKQRFRKYTDYLTTFMTLWTPLQVFESHKPRFLRVQRSSRNSSQAGGISGSPRVYYSVVECDHPSTCSWFQGQHNDVFTRSSLPIISKKVLNGIS